jgi:putative serine protease PepD
MNKRRSSTLLVVAALAGGAAGAGGVIAVAGDGSTATQPTGAAAGPAAVERPAAATSGVPQTVNQIYRAASPGVVDITVTQGQSSAKAEGSGFEIDRNGHIVTNQHVVSGATSIEVKFSDGSTAPAQLVGSDASSDIAVIKVNVAASRLHPLSFGDSGKLQVGDAVLAIGSPFGLTESATTGIVSALGRTIDAPNHYSISGAVQTDAAINHGNSGGPLLDATGKVVGVNAQIESNSGGNDGVGFAIPSNTVQRVATALAAGQSVEHAYLGIQAGTSSSPAGARVSMVRAGAPAASGGLRAGDVVTVIAGKRIQTADQLTSAVNAEQPGKKLTFTIVRSGHSEQLTVTLGSRPSA